MNENSEWLRERRRQEQAEAERRYAESAANQASQPADAVEPTTRPDRPQRSCSICLAAGLTDEAKGHISIGHDTWLRQQPAHLQAHFKGQGAPADLEPRLVKPPRADDSDRNSEE
jgi:hypothetical protein